MANHKKYVPLLSLMILSSSLTSASDNYSKTQLFGIATALTASAAAAIWYACQPYSTEDLLKKTSDLEFRFFDNIGGAYRDPRGGLIIGGETHSRGSEELAPCWDISIPLLDEHALGKYNRGSSFWVHTACTKLIDEVSYLKSKFPQTILREKDSVTKAYLETKLLDLEDVHCSCLFLDKLVSYHKAYFDLHLLTKQLSAQYAQELRALTYSYQDVRSLYSFKRVNQLSADLKKLQALLFDEASRRYPNVRSEAEYLSYDLSSICNHMLSDPRYALDLYNEQLAEELRLERLRNQMLRDQMYHSYNQPTTHVHVGIEYTIDKAPEKTTKQEVAPVEPKPTVTPPAPISETKSEKPATLETNLPSIFDPEYGMCI